MKFVIKYSGGDMFAECNGRKEVDFLKKIIYKNYQNTVFKTNKNFSLRAKMFSMPLKNNDTLSDLLLKDNSDLIFHSPNLGFCYLNATHKKLSLTCYNEECKEEFTYSL